MIAAGLMLPAGMAALTTSASTPAIAADEARLEIVTSTGRHPFRIEIAATPQTRATGLMFRKALDPDYGMLFDFHREAPVSFWMKNTFVSLDMIFIRADGTVANVATGTTPFSEEPVSSAAPVRFVLEVVAGTASKIGLKAGDRIVHPLVAGSK